MSSVFFMFQSILNIFGGGDLKKISIFKDEGSTPPFAENSAKIINLIF